MLKNCGEALGLLGCVLKRHKILMKFDSAGPVCKNGTCPTCLKIAGEALGILGCVLKRLKILMKFDRAGPAGKNGAKF